MITSCLVDALDLADYPASSPVKSNVEREIAPLELPLDTKTLIPELPSTKISSDHSPDKLNQIRESNAALWKDLREMRLLIETLVRPSDRPQTDAIDINQAKLSDQAPASHDRPIELLCFESHSHPISSLSKLSPDDEVGAHYYHSIELPSFELLSSRISSVPTSKVSHIDPGSSDCSTTLTLPDSNNSNLDSRPLSSTKISNTVLNPNLNNSLTNTDSPTFTDQVILASSLTDSSVCNPPCVSTKKKKKKKTKTTVLETIVPDTHSLNLTLPSSVYAPRFDDNLPPPTPGQIQQVLDQILERHQGLKLVGADDQGLCLGKDCTENPFEQDFILYSYDGTLLLQVQDGVAIHNS